MTIRADAECIERHQDTISSNLQAIGYAMACHDHLSLRENANPKSLQADWSIQPYCDAAFASKGTNSEASFAAITSASSAAYPWGLRSSTS